MDRSSTRDYIIICLHRRFEPLAVQCHGSLTGLAAAGMALSLSFSLYLCPGLGAFVCFAPGEMVFFARPPLGSTHKANQTERDSGTRLTVTKYVPNHNHIFSATEEEQSAAMRRSNSLPSPPLLT